MLKTILVIIFALAVAMPALAQEKKPTLAEMRKNLIILNLRLENMQLRYKDTQENRDRMAAMIKAAEKTQGNNKKAEKAAQARIVELEAEVKALRESEIQE